jgi:multiple antibiotic resistance protein
MEGLLAHALTAFMGFFAIMNPIANVPIFISLTESDDRQTVKAVALRSLILAFIIVAVFSVAGNLIFKLFGITLPAFRITGGLLVFFIGFHMLQGNLSSIHHLKKEDYGRLHEAELSVATFPLAMPILAGPGTIATAIIFATKGGIPELIITIGAFTLLCIITYFFFVFGEKFVKFIGVGALGVITRMMGLVLAVIGTQMVIEGVKGFFS